MTGSDLKILAMERVQDAKALHAATRYSGAMYLCGYAVECALKSRICMHLGWTTYKIDSKVAQMKIHNFDDLLSFTGIENQKKTFLKEWNVVANWKPDMRYEMATPTPVQTQEMISSTEAMLKVLI